MSDEEKMLEDVYAAQRELARHRDGCPTCRTACSVFRYCLTGTRLLKELDAARDRYYAARRKMRTPT